VCFKTFHDAVLAIEGDSPITHVFEALSTLRAKLQNRNTEHFYGHDTLIELCQCDDDFVEKMKEFDNFYTSAVIYLDERFDFSTDTSSPATVAKFFLASQTPSYADCVEIVNTNGVKVNFDEMFDEVQVVSTKYSESKAELQAFAVDESWAVFTVELDIPNIWKVVSFIFSIPSFNAHANAYSLK